MTSARIIIALAVAYALLFAGPIGAAPSASHHASVIKEQVYVRRATGQEPRSIILRPDGTVLYGTGGPNGIRHRFVAGTYRVRGKTIILNEYNKHNPFGDEWHQTELPYSATTIGGGGEEIYRRCRFSSPRRIAGHVFYLKQSTVYELPLREAFHHQMRPYELARLRNAPVFDTSASLLGFAKRTLYLLDRGSIWAIDVRTRRCKPLAESSEACLMAGRYLLYTVSASGKRPETLHIQDLKTHQSKLFTNAYDPIGAMTTPEFAWIYTTPEAEEGSVCVFNLRSKNRIFATDNLVNPTGLRLSSTGRYLAWDNHLSRPVTGDAVYDLKRARDITDRYDAPGFLPPLVDDWSPNERFAAWEWRTADPDNSGSWKQSYVGVTSITGRWRHRMGVGSDARFTLDGTHVLWRVCAREGETGDLLMADIHGGKTVTLANGVTSYLVIR